MRRGPGRPPGSRNRKSAALRQAIAAGKTPLEFLVETYTNDDLELGVRLDAAKAAAPYCHPRLSAIDVSAEYLHQVEQPVREMTMQELTREWREMLDERDNQSNINQ